jgi:hypothetical protein
VLGINIDDVLAGSTVRPLFQCNFIANNRFLQDLDELENGKDRWFAWEHDVSMGCL